MHPSYFQVAAANACNPAVVLQQYLVSESIKRRLQAQYRRAFPYGQTPLTRAAVREPGSVLQQSPRAHRATLISHSPGQLRWRVKWPWHPTRASCSSPGEECAQPSVSIAIFFHLGTFPCNEATEGKGKLHHLGGDAEVAALSLEELFPPRTCPLQVQTEDASLAALSAETASVYLFSHFQQECN